VMRSGFQLHTTCSEAGGPSLARPFTPLPCPLAEHGCQACLEELPGPGVRRLSVQERDVFKKAKHSPLRSSVTVNLLSGLPSWVRSATKEQDRT